MLKNGGNSASSIKVEDLGWGGRLPGDRAGTRVHAPPEILSTYRDHRFDHLRLDGLRFCCLSQECIQRPPPATPGVDPTRRRLLHRILQPDLVDALGGGGEANAPHESGRRLDFSRLDHPYSGLCSAPSRGADPATSSPG